MKLLLVFYFFISLNSAMAQEHILTFWNFIPYEDQSKNQSDQLQLKFYSSQIEYLKKYLGNRKIKIHNLEKDSFEITQESYPISKEKPNSQYLNSSFLIDYKEEAIDKIIEIINEKIGKNPTPTNLAEFVTGVINKKRPLVGISPASFITKTQEGDSLSHSILLTALLRSYNHPSKVVLGIKLDNIRGKKIVLGHSWVEYWEKDGWLPIDAVALAPEVERSDKVKLFKNYIPMLEISDETIGFKNSFLKNSMDWIVKIDIK